MMDETAFLNAATATLISLADAIEQEDEDVTLDVEVTDGVLTITLPDRTQYVVNRHLPSRRIWASSPKSGAHYFDYDTDNRRWHERGLILEEWLLGELRYAGVLA